MSSDDEDPKLKKKVVIIGNSSVGKTSLLLHYTEHRFRSTLESTIGIDYREKDLVVSNQEVHLQIWDTAGQERFKTITRSYYRNCDGIIVVYDVTQTESFEQVKGWVESVHKYAEEEVPILVIGNKIDLSSKRAVNERQGKELAKTLGTEFIETSAKTGVNINFGFEMLTKKMLLRNKKKTFSKKQKLKESDSTRRKNFWC
ncbi:ras and ef-hand domain-containing protein [Anaeramoeba flamelloides]|uniref:Ras and ef-hand domain-containing protein n=1 Tax=Anaeramoeba flamelloides TaxID=1746091 RepID=A0AAV7Z540_9EUKA|nr:ras and ef-hand domain-containing protein [Anaeramoeba flamelloides]KAJ6251708.1 ras and ef-hand domain-containing protein [Anaeramoeba flamelloides]